MNLEETMETLYLISVGEHGHYQKMVRFITKHFEIIEHMKKTSLYDVLMYEKEFEDNSLEQMKIIVTQNNDLKKEVNKLRKELGLSKKYKE